MKKIILVLLGLFVFNACLNSDDDVSIGDFTYEYLPIDKAITPASFTYGDLDTITVSYSLPNSCYSFHQIYYQAIDTTRIVAITAFVELPNSICTTAIVQEEKKFVVNVNQQDDYVFKFFKGKDSNGDNIFEEVIVPVN
jgi:hypothetical protein